MQPAAPLQTFHGKCTLQKHIGGPQGNWNKESMIRKVLADTPRSAAEWVLWLDVDTVLPHAGALPRWGEYEGRDLVVWGDAAQLDAGNMNRGASTTGSRLLGCAIHSVR